jgi:hypothetical protein
LGKRKNCRSVKLFEITPIKNHSDENGTCYSDAKSTRIGCEPKQMGNDVYNLPKAEQD